MFGDFKGVAVWGARGWTRDDTRRDPYRVGFELFLGPYRQTTPFPRAYLVDSLTVRTRAFELDSILTGRHVDSTAARNASRSLAALQAQQKEHAARTSPIAARIGVGLDFSDSYLVRTDSVEVRAPTRGIYLAAYLEHDRGLYVGGLGAYYSVWNGTAHVLPRRATEILANTFGFEVMIGVEIPLLRSEESGPFLELGYRYLAFEGVRYGDSASGRMPLAAPRRLDISGPSVTIGYSLERRK